MAAEAKRVTYGFVAKATMVVIGVWALAQALWLVRDILFVAFGSVLLAVFFSLLVDRLAVVLPRWLAGLITLLVFLALVAGFWIVAWPRIQGQVIRLAEDVPRILSSVVDWIRAWSRELVPGTGVADIEADRTMQQRLGTEAMNMVAGALPLLNTAIGAVTGIFVTVFAAVFLVINPRGYLEGFLHLVPRRARARIREALLETGTALRRWIAGMSVSMVIIFTASTAGLYLLGIPAALVLGMIAGALVFIPFIGPTLSALPAMAMALTVSPMMVVWVALLYLGIQLLESNFLTPIVMREAVELEPAATILFQLAMGVLFGFLGLFLAVPFFAAVRVLVKRLYIDALETPPDPAQPGSPAR
ncbi:MAG: AI-2E family transporter [Gemmatimonadota bacterium]